MASVNLEADLETALQDALQGDPVSARLAARLDRTAQAVLLRHGIRGARIAVEAVPGGMSVAIELPPAPRRVRQIVVRIAG
jgi:hypothetical protein